MQKNQYGRRQIYYEYLLFQIKYSGTQLIWSPMVQKNLAVLMGGQINEGFFYKKMNGSICQAARKSDLITRWPYYWGGRKAEFHCISLPQIHGLSKVLLCSFQNR